MNEFTYYAECPLCHQDVQVTETPTESGRVIREQCRTCDYDDVYEVADEEVRKEEDACRS